jgi:predicted nucleic acid-binding protein
MDTVVIDACLAITFGNVGELHLLYSTQHRRVVMTARSRSEVAKPPAETSLDSAVHSGGIGIEAVDLDNPVEQTALVRFDSRPAFRNRGDAETLALAVTRGYILGSDDRAVRSAAVAEIGQLRLAGTVDFLRWAVLDLRLTANEAAALLPKLDTGDGIILQVTRRGMTILDLFK